MYTFVSIRAKTYFYCTLSGIDFDIGHTHLSSCVIVYQNSICYKY